MINIFFLISLIMYLVYSIWKLRKDLHMIQLNSYVTNRFFKWIKQNFVNIIKAKDFLPAFALIPLYFEKIYVFNLIWIACYCFLFLTRGKVQEKKKLVFTNRVKRLFTISILLIILVLSIIYSKVLLSNNLIIPFIFLILLNPLSSIVMLTSNLLITPVEKSINRWFYNDARKKIKQMNRLTVIGITGSFGKTTTKYILNKILSEKYNTLMTPESYNTPMGITKIIRTQLKPTHDIFIAEMGAMQKGDISELCRLVSPKIGLLTACVIWKYRKYNLN